MLYRTLVLREKAQPRAKQCSVMKAWDNAQYVRIVEDHIHSQWTSSKLDKGRGPLCQELMSNSQTQSAMADHDPEIALSLTPAKRVSVHQGLEELSSPTMETTQQSSTKAMKNIKIKKT